MNKDSFEALGHISSYVLQKKLYTLWYQNQAKKFSFISKSSKFFFLNLRLEFACFDKIQKEETVASMINP